MVYWQGYLDGLCGVYSVVNACSGMFEKELKPENYQEIFSKLCEKLEEEGKLYKTLVGGMTVKTLGRLIDVAFESINEILDCKLEKKIAFRNNPDNLKDFWEKISLHVEKYGKGSVILVLTGRHDHWTCVEEITDKSIKLIDSSGLKRVVRKKCTIGESKGDRIHILVPTQTYLVFRN